MVRRAAFTLIELIFAIVIISIVVLSLPSLSTTNSAAIESSLTQEGIFAASARLSQVLSYQWDDNSDNNNSVAGTDTYDRAVELNGNAALNRIGGTSKFRVGHIQEDTHRQFHERVNGTDYNASGIGSDGNDDIDDFDTGANKVDLFTASGELEGYKKNYRVNIDVNYFSDVIGNAFSFTQTAATGDSNMKLITITMDIEQADGSWEDGAVVLRSYAANIGEIDYHKRRYP